MSNSGTVTIFTAAYNQAAFLKRSVESALAQDYGANKTEIIVINDGSTDTTAEVLKEYETVPNVRIVHQENRGLGPTCNRGLELASGEYFIRLDSDDWADPRMVSLLVAPLLNDPAVAVAYSDRYIVWSDGRQELEKLGDSNMYEMAACGVMMRTADVRDIGGYRKTFWEEYDLFLRLMQKGKFLHISEPLYYYYRHSANMTNDPEKRIEGWKELIELHGKDALRTAGDPNTFPELAQLIAS